jgi:hypothetical protein
MYNLPKVREAVKKNVLSDWPGTTGLIGRQQLLMYTSAIFFVPPLVLILIFRSGPALLWAVASICMGAAALIAIGVFFALRDSPQARERHFLTLGHTVTAATVLTAVPALAEATLTPAVSQSIMFFFIFAATTVFGGVLGAGAIALSLKDSGSILPDRLRLLLVLNASPIWLGFPLALIISLISTLRAGS